MIGGWCFVAITEDGEEIIKSGGEESTTNNRMELMGIVEGLFYFTEPCEIQIISDSTYCVNSINKWIKNWQRNNWVKNDGEKVKNADLMELIYEKINFHNVTAKWVKGHNGNHYNEIADIKAVEMCQNFKSTICFDSTI